MSKKSPFAPFGEHRSLEGDFFQSKKPLTLEQELVSYCLSRNITGQDFISWFTKIVQPSLTKEIKRREAAKKKLRQEFAEEKRKRELPENAIVGAFLGRIAYPNAFEGITSKYSLSDFVKVYSMAVNGKFDVELGGAKVGFNQWMNMIIQQKQAEEPVSPEEASGVLRKLVRICRGNR